MRFRQTVIADLGQLYQQHLTQHPLPSRGQSQNPSNSSWGIINPTRSQWPLSSSSEGSRSLGTLPNDRAIHSATTLGTLDIATLPPVDDDDGLSGDGDNVTPQFVPQPIIDHAVTPQLSLAATPQLETAVVTGSDQAPIPTPFERVPQYDIHTPRELPVSQDEPETPVQSHGRPPRGGSLPPTQCLQW